MEFDNPAQRLLDLLVEGKDLNPKLNCKAAWKHLLDAKSESEAVFLSRMGKVLELPEKTMALLASVGENDDDAHQHWVGRVSTAFSNQDFSGYWEGFSNSIDSHCMSYLKISARLLNAHKTISDIPEDDLVKVKSEIQELLDNVLESNLNDDIKKYLVRSLQRILVAVQEYKLTGAVPIIEALEVTIGHGVTDSSFREALIESDIGKQVWEVIFKLSSIVSIAAGVPVLSSGIQLLLN